MKIKIIKFEIVIRMELIAIVVLSLIFKKVYTFFKMYYFCFLFAMFHETMHMFMASVFGINPIKIEISAGGVNLTYKKEKLKPSKWLAIYSAGPVSNLLLAAIFFNIDFIKNINIIIALVNLLPIFPLDGYNILKTILLQKNVNITKIEKISKIILFFFSITTLMLFMVTKNFSLLVFPITLFIIGEIKQ